MSEVPDSLAADLAALADGRLDAVRRGEVEAALSTDPAVAADYERQRAAMRAIVTAAASVEAPHDLRTRIALGTRRAAPPRRWWRITGLAGIGAVAAAALVIALTPSGLTVEGVLAAAAQPPVAAVSVDPLRPALLREELDGVRFPNYEERFDWKATGARSDTIDGRRTRTVFYEKAGAQLAYTIVAGDALDEPDARERVFRDVKLLELHPGGRNVVTWRRQGHTCVMSGRATGIDEMIELAAWKARGNVPF